MDENIPLKPTRDGGTTTGNLDLRARCPSCLHLVTLKATRADDLLIVSVQGEEIGIAGFRFCPNPECRQFIFVVYEDEDIIRLYPAERIDFDATNIPNNVLATLEEAISCHASRNYVAAGMMVRKTLEELCEDRKVKGPNLKDRIADLGNAIMMPKELLDGLDDLRLLGNDAAHVEAKTYFQVGKEEIEISLEFTKEILKAAYQYGDLLARLRRLKKS